MESRFFRQMTGMLQRILEIVAEFDHFGAQATRCRVLLWAVPMRNNDHGPKTGTNTGEGYTLTKVAARGRNDSFDFRILASKLGEIE